MWRLEDNEKWSHLVQSSTPVPLEDAEIVPIPEKQPSKEEWEETYVFIRKISDNRFLAVKLTDKTRKLAEKELFGEYRRYK